MSPRLASVRRGASGRSLAAAVAGALAVGLPGAARADVFGPISLASVGSVAGGPVVQADYAHDAAMSADGRYVAFDGSVGGVTGVWRREESTGAIEQVAGGDAEMPSISADGQYISFTTNEGRSLPEISHGLPVKSPQREAVQVYVRNMALAPLSTRAQEEELGPTASERAFIVVSAPTCAANPGGCGEAPQPLAYAAGTSTSEGAYAAPRSAISADGSEVAFVTDAVSNLIAYPEQEALEREAGETPVPHTPALQVAVRQLDANRTVLVSRCYANCGEAADAGAAEPVVGSGALGAVLPAPATLPAVPASGAWTGASISADGSTVAWMGENLGEQAPQLAGEDLPPQYAEPLWRRIAAGSETQTMRVTGGSDPTNPACVASGETVLPSTPNPADPCQGPFEKVGGEPVSGIWPSGAPGVGDFIPRLSRDGFAVAFLSEAALVGRRDHEAGGQYGDLYVASMRPGPTRSQALTPLTAIGIGGLAAEAPIADFEISPDGEQVAFATVRTNFVLGSPAFVSATAAQPGIGELFDADVGTATLTRVTHGYLGGSSEQTHPAARQSEEDPYGGAPFGLGAFSPSFSADGSVLAFTSTADNLVYGDGNTPETPSTEPENGSDVFVVGHEAFVPLPTQQYVSPPPLLSTEPEWRLGVTALTRRDGSVLLYVQLPGAGVLRASASASVVSAHGSSARRTRSARRGRIARRVLKRTVASSTRTVSGAGEGPVTIVLRLSRSWAALAFARGGLSATASVSFSARGEPTLHASLPVSFRAAARTSRSKPKHRRAGGARSHTAGSR